MYHRIARERFDPWGLAVDPLLFDQQLSWLARNRTVLPLSEFAQRRAAGKLSRDAVAVTFDDGYACVLEAAVPLLIKHEVRATVFLPAELIARQQGFWWDELAHIVLNQPAREIRVDGQTLPVPPAHEDDGSWQPDAAPNTPRQQLFHDLWSMLRSRGPEAREAGMAELRGQAPEEGPGASHRLMTEAEIRQAAALGVEFGSHALTHSSLPHLDGAEQKREINDSVDRCAALTGSVPRSFAYPYGDHNGRSRRLVEQAGFACACSTDPGFVSRHSPMFALPRIPVGNWDGARLAAVLAGR